MPSGPVKYGGEKLLVDGITSIGVANYQSASMCELVKTIELVKHAGCNPKMVASYACAGACPSYVQVSGSNSLWQHERSCSCCQQTQIRESSLILDCPSLDPPYKELRRVEPVDCVCRMCDDIGKEELLLPQELIDVGIMDPSGRSIVRNKYQH